MHAPALAPGYEISTDPARLNLDVIHGFLTQSYWAKGIKKELVARSIANSMCWGLYHHNNAQVGFARLITDRTTFAYLCDVFVLDEHRGQGLATALVASIHAHPELQGLRRWMLVTVGVQPLYEQLGWKVVKAPERHMEVHDPDVYLKANAS